MARKKSIPAAQLKELDNQFRAALPYRREAEAFSAGVRWAQDAAREAEQLKKGPRQQLGVRILTDLHRKVTIEAARRGVSLSALIEDMIRRELRIATLGRTLAKSVTKVTGKNKRGVNTA